MSPWKSEAIHALQGARIAPGWVDEAAVSVLAPAAAVTLEE
jgi:hypothetical protein